MYTVLIVRPRCSQNQETVIKQTNKQTDRQLEGKVSLARFIKWDLYYAIWRLGSSKKHRSVDECTEVCWPALVEKLMPPRGKECFQQYFSLVSPVMHFQVAHFAPGRFQSNQWSPFSLLFRGISRHLALKKWRPFVRFVTLSNTACLYQNISCRKSKQKDLQRF